MVAYVLIPKINAVENPNERLQINPYMSNPCHIELILTEGEEVVQKGPQVAELEKKRLNSRQRGAQLRRAITQG